MDSSDDAGMETSPEGLYPMRVVARLTGLPADTIRAWEKRYGVVQPNRTDGRARRYSEAEVRRLTTLREATERGHSIGAIGRLTDAALAELAEKPLVPQAPDAPRVSPLEASTYLDHVERFELRRALDLITRRAALTEPREFCLTFLEPVLAEIGRRWEHGQATVLHEHIVSTHVKTVLGVYSRLASYDAHAARVAFLTPERHLHEFGINIGAILATTRNVEPIVLGPDVPYALLGDFVTRVEPDALVFGVSRDFDYDELVAYRDAMHALVPRTEIWIGCARENVVSGFVEGARYFHDFGALDAAFVNLARR